LRRAIQAAGSERRQNSSVLNPANKNRTGVANICTTQTWQQQDGARGEAVGIISAQSIGEPGTQLTK